MHRTLALDSITAKQKPYGSAPKWPDKKVKALGVWFSIDPDITIFQDYNNKLEKNKYNSRLLQVPQVPANPDLAC